MEGGVEREREMDTQLDFVTNSDVETVTKPSGNIQQTRQERKPSQSEPVVVGLLDSFGWEEELKTCRKESIDTERLNPERLRAIDDHHEREIELDKALDAASNAGLPRTIFQLFLEFGRCYFEQGNTDGVKDLYNQLLQVANTLQDEQSKFERSAYVYNNYAYGVLLEEKKLQEADDMLMKAIANLKKCERVFKVDHQQAISNIHANIRHIRAMDK